MAESTSVAERHTVALVYLLLLECLGFVVNTKKSVFQPQQSLEFLGRHGNVIAKRQIEKDSAGGTKVIKGGCRFGTVPISFDWEDECNQSSNTSSPTVLSKFTNVPPPSTENESLSELRAKSHNRAGLVGEKYEQMEWESLAEETG